MRYPKIKNQVKDPLNKLLIAIEQIIAVETFGLV